VNEVSPQSLEGLELGLAALDPAARDKVSVVTGPAGAATAMFAGADVVVADPPRKGLDRELLDALARHPAERFIYVSCGLASLIADTSRLTAAGMLRLQGLAAFDLMPYTEHVETVACFVPA
jgi:tRNA/tmRNA/rRNA uracil-C5-methylase (TrmA/RlmC/RlmD family)